jgi:hypothetical protein
LIDASRGITDFIGHFEIEQLFEKSCSFCVWEDVGELREAEITAVPKDVEYFVPEGRDVVLFEIEGLLDGSWLAGGLPIHGIEKILD